MLLAHTFRNSSVLVGSHRLFLLSVFLGNVAKARAILANLDNVVPGLASIKLRRASLERRCKEFASACSIYETAINENSDKDLISFYSIKYARFLAKVQHVHQKRSGG